MRTPLLTALFFLLATATAAAQPAFDASFTPGPIAAGSWSRLTLTITNTSSAPVTDLAFVDTLPASLVLGPEALITNACEGTVSAPTGGTTIALSGGRLAPSASCSVGVEVSGSLAGSFVNTTSDLTSSAGNSGSATSTLDVFDDRIQIAASVAPNPVLFGGTTTLTVTLTNPAGFQGFGLFDIALPDGVTIANPTGVLASCANATVTALAGASTASVTIPSFAAGVSCEVMLDVDVANHGQLPVVTSDLVVNGVDSGHAVAIIDAQTDDVLLVLDVLDDPVVPGGVATLQVQVLNRDRFDALDDLTLTLDLDGALAGLVATGLPTSGVCGAGSTLSGTSVLSLSSASVPPEGDCRFQVALQLPASAAGGRYPLSSSTVAATRAGAAVEGAAATTPLWVGAGLVLSKAFSPMTVAAGSIVDVEYTLTDVGGGASSIQFTDRFAEIAGGITLVAPVTTPCGPGSSGNLTFLDTDDPAFLLTNGELAPGASCTFVARWQLPADLSAGIYTSPTSDVSATVGGAMHTATGATATLEVAAAPRLALTAPVRARAGDTIQVEYVLHHGANATDDAVDIAFSHDLDANLAGLTVGALPGAPCGPASALTATATGFALTGGELGPDAACAFTIDLTIPATAPPGTLTLQTSPVTATSAGLAVSGRAATVDVSLDVLRTTLSAAPVNPGAVASVVITLENLSTTDTATSGTLTLTPNGPAGFALVNLPMTDVCGVGSQVIALGAGTALVTGATLDPGTSCTFSIDVQVPASAPAGDYPVDASATSWMLGGQPVNVAPTRTQLIVADALFGAVDAADEPVFPRDTVDLIVTLANADAATATGVTTSLDLSAIPGATAASLPVDPCGTGSTLTQVGDLLTLSGGTLDPATSCTFAITVTLPAAVPVADDVFVGLAPVEGDLGGVAASAPGQGDVVEVRWIESTLVADAPLVIGQPGLLVLTLTNRDAVADFDALRALASLPAEVSATADVQADACGTGSNLTITELGATLSDGSLAAMTSCSMTLEVLVGDLAAPATVDAVAGPVFESTLEIGAATPSPLDLLAPALTSTLELVPPSIDVGATTTLTLAIDNATASVVYTGLGATLTLPAGLSFASDAATSCAGASASTPATDTLVLSAGSLSPMSACEVTVTVLGDTAGSYTLVADTFEADFGEVVGAQAMLEVVETVMEPDSDVADAADVADTSGDTSSPGDTVAMDTRLPDTATAGEDTSVAPGDTSGLEVEIEVVGGSDDGCCTTVRSTPDRDAPTRPLPWLLALVAVVVWRRRAR